MEQRQQCPSCHDFLPLALEGKQPHFCPFCGYPLHPSLPSIPTDSKATRKLEVSPAPQGQSLETPLLEEPPTEKERVQFTVGPYEVIRLIGRGGMGEVFLAYDTSCGRRIALKRIRADYKDRGHFYSRFLKEAKITSQLTHPAIIPIYTIHAEGDTIFYTMPYVQGNTLKQILRKAREQEKAGERTDRVGGAIPTLARTFTTLCQAVAYAHAKGVLHRDLKPENVIVGKYGEVLILDWGLATLIQKSDQDEQDHAPTPVHLTQSGKVVGTVHYMAPERALGRPATIESDIYALGVILYQILTLHLPFPRADLSEFRKNMHKEVLTDPATVAPYRDVPQELTRVVSKCLMPKIQDRYHSVDALIHDLDNYLEGRSEWFQIAELRVYDASYWEFQENVLITEHTAITRHTEVWEWVFLMISKKSFSENVKVEARVRIGEGGHGVGFLLNIPEAGEREHLNGGYYLWLSSDPSKETKLMRATVEVLNAPEIVLNRNEWYRVRIEKVDNSVHVYLNDQLAFSYISHLPVLGTHIGLMVRDEAFEIEDFFISVGGHAITVSCLAVPDAFLANRDFSRALHEYRRIGQAFPGRAEGREALFRAGITLMEEGKAFRDPELADNLFNQALEEFTCLRSTPGAPLEYLGKALVYQSMGLHEEEIKCYELAFRRYKKHPLLPILQEHIVYRLHEASRLHRSTAYRFALLVLQHLPREGVSGHTRRLFFNLQKHWEALPFIEEDKDTTPALAQAGIIIQLAFWLAKPWTLSEVLDGLIQQTPLPVVAIGNAFFALLELGCIRLAAQKIEGIARLDAKELKDIQPLLDLIAIAVTDGLTLPQRFETFFQAHPATHSFGELRLLFHLMDRALHEQRPDLVIEAAGKLNTNVLSPDMQQRLDCIYTWALLATNAWKEAGEILHKYPLEMLNEDTSPLHFLYGCWLGVTEGKEIARIHFSGTLEVTYPRSWALTHHHLLGKLDAEWEKEAFVWERRQFHRQLALYYHCMGDQEASRTYQKAEREDYLDVYD